MEANRMIRWQTLTGDPVTIGDTTINTQSQALVVRWPGGGYVWNRPVALLVQNGQGSKRIQIIDTTRMAQLGLLGAGLIFSVLVLAFSIRERRAK